MLVVVDIDGTLADTSTREKLAVEASKAGPEAKQKAWDDFHAGIPNDMPVRALLQTIRALAKDGHDIDYWTARPEKYRQMTVDWLDKHRAPMGLLKMRPDGDLRPSPIVKLEWYFKSERKPQLLFEDHPETVKLFRDAGCVVANMGDGRNHA